MDRALQDWKQHRTDYRVPTLLSLLLWFVLMSSSPSDWLRVSPRVPGAEKALEAPILDTGLEGIQLIEVALPMVSTADPIAPEASVYEIDEAAPETGEPDREGSTTSDESWSFDPTPPHALVDELLASPKRASAAPPPSLTPALSLNGVSAYALGDTSQVAVAQAGFSFTQRQIIARNRPAWAQQAWEDRMRGFWHRVIMDDPLRGPQ